jgi:hypothetical protein
MEVGQYRYRCPTHARSVIVIPMDGHLQAMWLASIFALVAVVRLATFKRPDPPSFDRVLLIVFLVVSLGVLYGRFGAQAGFPWWLYALPPIAVTILVPVIAFRMSPLEGAIYTTLALLSAPVIHGAFSLLLGWNEFMPFLPLPSVRELLS